MLTTTVDSKNKENIEVINQKASAGYRTGFADPEYIKVLPTFQLPFLSADKKYRKIVESKIPKAIIMECSDNI